MSAPESFALSVLRLNMNKYLENATVINNGYVHSVKEYVSVQDA